MSIRSRAEKISPPAGQAAWLGADILNGSSGWRAAGEECAETGLLNVAEGSHLAERYALA
jgi:hypothetical protein